MKQSYVYILANKPHGTLYIGVTSNLVKRIYEHRTAPIDSFTSKYQVKKLVYFEVHSEMTEAILKEKKLKRWRRQWKIELIEGINPCWNDLYEEIIG